MNAAGRQADQAVGGSDKPEASHSGARRKVSQHHIPRLRPRPGRGGSSLWPLLQHGIVSSAL